MMNIGDFARVAGVSVRMLRHYDTLGLLTPSAVDPFSGYRRYDESLLPRAHRLVALKELGFSLDEVRAMLDNPDPETVRELMRRRRDELGAQIERDQARLDEVERRLRIIEGGEMSGLEFEEKALPALRVVARTEEIADLSEVGAVIGPMFEGLAQQLAEAGDPPSHPGVAWYEPVGEHMRVGAGYLDKREAPDGAAFYDLPRMERAVVTTYVGPMSGISNAWQELAEHVRSQGLTFAGPCRELYHEVRGPQEGWITELQQPVG